MDLPYVFVSLLQFASSKDSFPKAEILSWQNNFSYADLGTFKRIDGICFLFFPIFSHKLHEVFGVVTGGIKVIVGTPGPIGLKMLL